MPRASTLRIEANGPEYFVLKSDGKAALIGVSGDDIQMVYPGGRGPRDITDTQIRRHELVDGTTIDADLTTVTAVDAGGVERTILGARIGLRWSSMMSFIEIFNLTAIRSCGSIFSVRRTGTARCGLWVQEHLATQLLLAGCLKMSWRRSEITRSPHSGITTTCQKRSKRGSQPTRTAK